MNLIRFYARNEDDLLFSIGKELNEFDSQAFLPSRRELILKATTWFETNTENFKIAVCGNEKLQKALKYDDEAQLIAIVADIIANICFGVSPVSVATLIVKIGVNHLCDFDHNSEK